jgi:large subunit ribosomal protein L27
MSHVKAGGTSKNTKDSPGQRLGVKRFGGQTVRTGEVLVRQIGRTKLAGDGTFMSRNYTIHAAKDGEVAFQIRKVKRYSGKTERRTEVIVR